MMKAQQIKSLISQDTSAEQSTKGAIEHGSNFHFSLHDRKFSRWWTLCERGPTWDGIARLGAD